MAVLPPSLLESAGGLSAGTSGGRHCPRSLEAKCLHRCTTAWIATAAASSLSPQTPVCKSGSERNAGIRPSCGSSTSWYVSSTPPSPVQCGLPVSCKGKDIVCEFQGGSDIRVLFSNRTVSLSNISGKLRHRQLMKCSFENELECSWGWVGLKPCSCCLHCSRETPGVSWVPLGPRDPGSRV